MARFGITAFVGLNIVVSVLSIVLTATGVSLAKNGGSKCETWLVTPLIVVGLFLIVVSMLGIAGAWYRHTLLLTIYIISMFLTILTLFSITFFVFAVTSKPSNESRLGNYSPWLRYRVTDPKNWKEMQKCLKSTNLCSKFQPKYMKDEINHFSAVEALKLLSFRCCKPPSECKFEYLQGKWYMTAASGNNTNPDCGSWDNDPKILCYNCNSCKVGMLKITRFSWKTIAKIYIAFLVVLLIMWGIGVWLHSKIVKEKALAQI